MKTMLLKDAAIALGCGVAAGLIYSIAASVAHVPGAAEDSATITAAIGVITFAVRRLRARARLIPKSK